MALGNVSTCIGGEMRYLDNHTLFVESETGTPSQFEFLLKSFLENVKTEVIQEPEKLRNTGIIKEELVNQKAIKEGVILKLGEANIQEKSKAEEENLVFKKAKGDFEQERLVFKEEKERFEQEKLKFEEKRENLKQERVRFEEEKQAFKWEKQMFEEIKKHEKEKGNDLRET